jgi:hypothetical protein
MVESTLKSLIGGLVMGGCHNTVNRSLTPVYPYAVIHEISGIPVNGVSIGYLGITRFTYQIDVFAKSQEEAKGLAVGSIRTAISASSILEGELISQMNGEYSELDKTFQYITEYVIWSS